MKLSQFTLFIPHYPTPAEYLVYNTLTQSMVVIGEELKQVLDNLPAVEPENPEVESLLGTLEETGIVAEDDVDETDLVINWLNGHKELTSLLKVQVLTTFACNFACPYCVETGITSRTSMDPAACDATIHWIQDRAAENDPDQIYINFYGGEPLLNVPPLVRISQALSAYAEENGIGFSTGITTNGSLLAPEIVDRLIPYGLRSVKVTLDGERDVHNRKRPFRDGSGSFDLIVSNILSIVDKVSVQLGGNFDAENVESIPGLLDHLANRGLASRLWEVEFKPITGFIADGESVSPRASDCVFFSDENLPEAFLNLRLAAHRRGFSIRTGLGISLCSMLQAKSGFVIDPEGVIYNCPALVGHELFAIGNVREEELNNSHLGFTTLEPWRECLDCVYLPVCGGGCRYAAYMRHGDFGAVACEKAFFDRVGPELLKMEYEAAMADEE